MKKIILIILICLVVTSLAFGGLVGKKEAQAQDSFGVKYRPGGGNGGLNVSNYTGLGSNLQHVKQGIGTGTPGIPTKDIGAMLMDIIDSVWQSLEKAYKAAGDIAYKNSLRYFLNKIAYDTATHIATGSPGKKPLFVTDWKKYFEQTKDEALGDFFTRLGDQVWGKDLCEPLNPLVKINLEVSAKRGFEPPKPRCDWEKIKKNIGDLRNLKFDQLVQFSTHFAPSGNELGAYLTLRTGAFTEQARVEKERNLVRVIEGSIKSVVNPITGKVKTPASFVQEAYNVSLGQAMSAEKVRTGNPWADAIGTFTNTLISKYLERIFKKGYNPQANEMVVSDFWTTGGVAGAKLLFNELAEPNYSFNSGIRLEELSIQGQGQFNEVIDDRFSKAVEEKCTIGQATGYYGSGSENYRPECANLISLTGYFGFKNDSAEAMSVNKNQGIPFRSILVLRKFRIVPVGWELAAEYYRDFEVTKGNAPKLTFKRLFKEYDDLNSPYYKLVDPDWQLKMPITRCVRTGAGPEKVGLEPYCAINVGENEECPNEYLVYPFQRLNYCADYQSCLDDLNGQCDVNDWGYCVEEKPVWNISGTECQKKYFSTCKSLTQTESNQSVSYLLNTVSGNSSGDESCNLSNKGCREYCTDFDSDTNSWTCEFGNSDNKINLTAASKQCAESDQGCHLFYSDWISTVSEVLLDNSVENYDGRLKENYFKLAPDYYHCDGYAKVVAGVSNQEDCENANHFWRDDLNLCVQSGSQECRKFVKMCEAKDTNCELYTPVSTKDPAVPAVVQNKVCPDTNNSDCADETDPAIIWNDECPASCVGFKNYHQMETEFEASPAPDPEFIAATATTCSQPGCDEFTNLDEVAKGGEGIEYYSYLRQCVKPDQSGWDTYYTWEGSDTEGYQLKKWNLMSAGSGPAGETCSDLTNADCREFFNQSLQSFKIFYSSTVVVSDDCHPFRRSGTTEISKCNNPNENFSNGVCVFWAVPKESVKCSAVNNLCREYRTNQSYNYQKIIESYFSNSSDLGGWSSGEGEVSNESVMRGDYSLHIVGDGRVEHDLVQGDLETGTNYTLEFLAKGSGNLTAWFDGNQNVADEVVLQDANNWWHYVLKLPRERPAGLTAEEATDNKIIIEVEHGVYLDNIILKKMQSIALIKDSWQTPAECQIVSGGKNMLGCEAYQKNNNTDINLRQFNNLCFEEVVGCQKVIDSKNSKNDISDDEAKYVVIDNDFKCGKEKKGCRRLGLITPDPENEENYSFTDKYKIVDPDKSAQQLCQANEIFCQEYKYQDKNGNPLFYYFKDPLHRLCQFGQINGQGDYWWLKLGTNTKCDSSTSSQQYVKHCLGGKSTSTANVCYTDSDCTNLAYPNKVGQCSDWTAVCDGNSSGCLEYQDPRSPKDCNQSLLNFRTGFCHQDNTKQCKVLKDSGGNNIVIGCEAGDTCDLDSNGFCNYYYYQDVDTCDSVNPSQGCVAFWETDNSNKDKRSYKVCVDSSGANLNVICNDDTDCATGKCIYYNN